MSNLLTPQDLHPYQKDAVLHGLYHTDAMYWIQMGLGKTAVALTVAVDRARAGQVHKVLVLAPLRVAQSVWHREARKWTHLQHLRFSILTGSRNARRRALFADADVYVINYENLNWLAEELDHFYLSRKKPLPFEMVIYDEITKMKNPTGVRMAGGNREMKDRRSGKTTMVHKTGWRKFINQFQYHLGLTGTPSPNGYEDLFGQFLALDGGQRLGTRVTAFRENYFTEAWDGYGRTVTEVGKECIEKRIADITLRMDAADHLKGLPTVTTTDLFVDLPPAARKVYNEMEANMFAELENQKTAEVFSRAAAGQKCLQIANGGVYTTQAEDEEEHSSRRAEEREWARVHDAKLEALEDVLEEAAGSPVLVAYAYRIDAARIMKKFKKLKPVNLTAVKASQTEAVLDKWRRGEIPLMIGHPASMGHGIDGLQDSCSLAVWYGLTYSWELYEQFNARINRQGQKHPVTLLRIRARDTLDDAVVGALEAKATSEAGLKAAVTAYQAKRQGLEVSFL